MELAKREVTLTCVLSAIISLLYVWKGIQEGWIWATYLIVISNILYLPIVIFLRQKGFIIFYTYYSILLVFIGGFTKTYLFNNFTAMFIACNVIMMKPQNKRKIMIIYAGSIFCVFILNDEKLYHAAIHVCRALWFYVNMENIIQSYYQRRPLVLTEDEKTILNELEEKKLLKACTSFSKNILTSKLKEARERNNLDTNAELLARYKETKV